MTAFGQDGNRQTSGALAAGAGYAPANPMPSASPPAWGRPPDPLADAQRLNGHDTFAADRFLYALRALVRCESCSSLLQVGCQNHEHPLPPVLLDCGQPTWALAWDTLHECWRRFHALHDRELLEVTLRELEASNAYDGVSVDDARTLLQGCFDGDIPHAEAGKVVIAELLRHFLVDLARGEAWQDWCVNGGPPPRDVEQRVAAIEQELDRALRYGNEPEGPLTDAQLGGLMTDMVELVQGVLVARQPAILGGPQKTLKTLLGLDMALSLATGTSWLGNPDWSTGSPCRVAFYSGESGGPVLLRKRQVMQQVKRQGLSPEQQQQFDDALAQDYFLWEVRRSHLPDLSDPHSIDRWRRQIVAREVEVVFIDPVLLCLGSAAKDLANSSATGQVIIEAVDALQAEGVTVVLLHHSAGDRSRRFAGSDREPLELSDLAYPGITQFMRQWITVNRADVYDEETRRSTLWVSIGGSGLQAGGVFRAVITEGRNHDLWQAHVESRSRHQERERVDQEIQEQEEQRDRNRRVLEFIRAHPGTTINAMARDREALAGIGEATLRPILLAFQGRGAIRCEQRGATTLYYPLDQDAGRRTATDVGEEDLGGDPNDE